MEPTHDSQAIEFAKIDIDKESERERELRVDGAEFSCFRRRKRARNPTGISLARLVCCAPMDDQPKRNMRELNKMMDGQRRTNNFESIIY